MTWWVTERFAAPVLRDEGEQAVLDLVPLARARRQVTDRDREAELVGEALATRASTAASDSRCCRPPSAVMSSERGVRDT